VDGTLLEAWASLKSFQRKDVKHSAPPDDPGNAAAGFHWEKRSNQTHESKTDPDAKLARKGKGKEARLSYNGNLLVENRNGLIVNTEMFQANGNVQTLCRADDAGKDSGHETGNRGRRQGLRHGGFRGRVPKSKGHAARGAEPGATRWERD